MLSGEVWVRGGALTARSLRVSVCEGQWRDKIVTRAPSLSGQALGGGAQGFTYHPSGDSGLALKSPDLAGVQGKSPSHPLEAVKGRGSSFSCVHLFSRYLLSVSCHATFVASGHKLGFCL